MFEIFPRLIAITGEYTWHSMVIPTFGRHFAATMVIGLLLTGTMTVILAWPRHDTAPLVPHVPARPAVVPPDTEANRALRAFPEAIDGARRIEKFEIPGASKVFVHIRQIHHHEDIIANAKEGGATLSDNERQTLRRQVEAIIEVQGAIDRILRCMAMRGMLTTLSPEGYLAGNKSDAKDCQAWCRSAVLSGSADKEDGRPMSERIDTEFARLKSGIARLLGRELDNQKVERLVYGAVYHIVGDGIVRPVANETLAQNLESYVCTKMRMDGRENAVLESSVNSATNIFAVTVMGGSHDFLGFKSARSASWLSNNYTDTYDRNNLNVPQNATFDVDPDDERLCYNVQHHVSAVRVRDPASRDRWVWYGNQDNVGLWNATHPNNKVSVIVITPDGYVDSASWREMSACRKTR
jgi:hypothetical protein